MKKLMFVASVICFAMCGFAKTIPVTVYDNGTNINFNVEGGKINVIFNGTVIDKEYDYVEIKIDKPFMEKCTIAYNMRVISGDRYCDLLINCRASDDRVLRFDEVIEQMIESDESKRRFIVEAIENYFKILQVVWLKRNNGEV